MGFNWHLLEHIQWTIFSAAAVQVGTWEHCPKGSILRLTCDKTEMLVVLGSSRTDRPIWSALSVSTDNQVSIQQKALNVKKRTSLKRVDMQHALQAYALQETIIVSVAGMGVRDIGNWDASQPWILRNTV